MASKLISFWVFFFLSTLLASPQPLPQFSFHGFKHASNDMTLNGVATTLKNGAIQLTNDSQRVVGHAFYSPPVRFKSVGKDSKALSFSAAFAFVVVPEYPKLGGHGFAFTISPTKELAGALPSQYLGLLNDTDIGNSSNHVFAVEFDTVRDFEFGDINDNHVGIDINTLKSSFAVPAAYFLENSTKMDLLLEGGPVAQAWIDYDSQKNRIEVRLSPFSEKPKLPILSYDVDLSPVLIDEMFVGFSASTGLLASSHYVLGWSFNMSGEAESLSLESLPSIPGLKKRNKTGLIVGVSLSVSILVILVIVVGLYIVIKKRNEDKFEDWELEIGPHRFSYLELKKATKGFRDKELLGFGGFGKVYKGTLPNLNTQVAVKRISHESKQGVREFLSEVSTIGCLRHRNLVQLLGWCRSHGDLLLVYDFMLNGSLDKYLFDDKPKTVLSWEQRFKIIKGVASALLYLHEECEQTVIHRDIKSANILLDADMNGRLGDFGLAKLYEHGANPSTTKVVGTLGYLAPELTRSGKPTTATDVYAFGAVLLEVVCGRRPIEPKALPEELMLVDWVWERWQSGAVLDVVDKRLNSQFGEDEAITVVKLGLMCSHNSPDVRPTIRHVVRYLEGEMPLPETVPAPDDFLAGKKGGIGSNGSESEGFVHSYPPSSPCIEKGSSTYSSGGGDEACSTSTAFSFSSRKDGR